MNLYFIDRTDDWGYDEYDSAVVASETVDGAKEHCPFNVDHVTCKLIGLAGEDILEGLVLGSFNAG